MRTIAELFPLNNANSARITITDEYTVINGAHIRISNGYFHKGNSPASVETKDILSVERQKLRNKRFLVFGLTLFGILLLLYGAFGYVDKIFTYQAAGDGDPKAALRMMIDVYGGALGSDIFYDDIAAAFQNDILTFDDFLLILEITEVGLDVHDAHKQYEAILTGSFIKPNSLYEAIKYLSYAILFIPSCVTVGIYTFKPVNVLRIKAMGGDFAVEIKYYQDEWINRLIGAYYGK